MSLSGGAWAFLALALLLASSRECLADERAGQWSSGGSDAGSMLVGRRVLGMPCIGAQEVVCGDDGTTYFSSCELEEAGAEKECQGPCPCEESGEGVSGLLGLLSSLG